MPNQSLLRSFALIAAGALIAFALSCAHAHTTSEPYAMSACDAPPVARVLAEGEGERRVRRPPPNATLPPLAYVTKVDCRTTGSDDLFMSYEDIVPGAAIRAHHHPHMDEILIIRHGSGIARLGTRETAVAPGAMVYIPRDTVVSLRNTGTVPLSIAFIFPHVGYGEYLREWSVADGEVVKPLTAEENAARMARARWLQIFEAP